MFMSRHCDIVSVDVISRNQYNTIWVLIALLTLEAYWYPEYDKTHFNPPPLVVPAGYHEGCLEELLFCW